MILWTLARARLYDLVHIHFSRSIGMLAIGASLRASRAPYVIQTHGMCEPWEGFAGLVDRLLTGPILRGARSVITLNSSEAARLREYHRLQNVVVIPNAVRLTHTIEPEISPPNTPARLLFCARLHPRKGLSVFTATCRQLSEHGLNIIAIIAGADEGAWTAAKLELEALGVPYEYVGSLAHGDALNLMTRADILLHPAPQEPFGMSMLEALSVGLPVVSASSAKIRQIADPYEAIVFVPDAAIECWATAVIQLLIDGEYRASRIRNGIRLVNHQFSLGTLTTRLKQLIESTHLSSPAA